MAEEHHPKVPFDNRKIHRVDVITNLILVSYKAEEEIQNMDLQNELVEDPILY